LRWSRYELEASKDMKDIVPLVLLATVLAGAPTHSAFAQQSCLDLSTFAGRGVGDGGPASAAVLMSPRNLAMDASGNIFIADAENARVRRIDAATGVITTVAGNGAPGQPTDGDQAVLASLKEPSGVALSSGGDLFIADIGSGVNTIWRVSADGLIHRFAGSGVATNSIDGPGGDPADDLNDGQLAVFATLNLPARVAVDGAGNVFIADFGNNLVRRVDATTGIMTTVASGLNLPVGLALGAGTDLFIANTGTNQILKGSTTGGALAPFAGNGAAALTGDEGPALAASLNGAAEIAVDASGVVFIGDTGNHVIRSVTMDGMIHRVAGSGIVGFQDGPGFLARFDHPGVALGTGQTLLVPDVDNNRIRKFDPSQPLSVSTIAGGDNSPGDGGPATAALLDRPAGLAIDGAGNVFITEHDSHRVRRVATNGTITTVVNSGGTNDSATDGTQAVTSPLRQPTGVSVDANGQLYIADAVDQRVLIVDTTGVIRTFAGTMNTAGFAGDGGPATSALLNTPLRTALASDGSVYIADFNNNRIRRVDSGGTINTVVGNGGELNQPAGLAFDSSGNLYIADFGTNRVLKIDTTGALSVVAGSGTAGKLGDNGPANAAQLNGPSDVALASDGALLVVDQLNNTIRRIAPGSDGSISGASVITTVLGDGRPAFADGPGTKASLLIPTDVEVRSDGALLIADRGNQRVRIATTGTDCPSERPCQSASDCDDADPCTVDSCGASSTCVHQPLPADQCQPACDAEPNGCVPGGGPRKSDCLAELLVKGAGGLRPVVRCRDNDASCDFDPTSGTCTFRIAVCLNEIDSRFACTSPGIVKLVAQGSMGQTILGSAAKMGPSSRVGRAVRFNPPLTTASDCSELIPVSVALKKNGTRPGKRQIKMTAIGAGRPRRDPDKVKLICMP
jgi:sugar lactone lactonase YvrE